jgi:hypothetical protein
MSSADLRPGHPQSVRIRPTDLGWVAAAVGMAASVGLLALRQANADDFEPGLTPWAFVGWFVLWSGPAIVGAIGAANGGRREVLVGSGLSYIWMAALSFSGVTFILLLPALLFLYAGLRTPPRAAATGRQDRPLVGIAIFALLVGSFIGLFGTLQTVCWERSADGTVRTHPEVIDANEGEVSVGIDGVGAAGCSGGQVSPLGSAIVVACVAGAAALAVGAGTRPRDKWTEPTATV